MLLGALTSGLGLELGLAVIVATILLRIALLPISWSAAYRGCVRQKRMQALQPEIDALKSRLGHDREVYARELIALHKSRKIALVDGKAILGSLAQLPVFAGMFHVLKNIGEGSRFLWMPSLARPDVLLAVIAGFTTALMVAANPDMPEQLRLVMLIVPAVVAVFSAMHFSSALALYWTTSNLFSAGQTLVLHSIVNRRLRSGKLVA
jgi:YidC/Oxa1 family membrane protein insertase